MNSIIIVLAALLLSLGIGLAAPGSSGTKAGIGGSTGVTVGSLAVPPDATPPPPANNDVILSGGPS